MRSNSTLSIISAALLSVAWLGLNGVTLLVAFIPLLLISSRYGASKKDFWRMFGWVALTFGSWSAATTWWIWYATPIGPILSVLITVALFGGVFMLFHWVSKRAKEPLAYTLLVAGWIACEYLYTIGEVSFPWLMLGNGFANDVKLVQWYEATGIFGGTLWIWIANIAVFKASFSRRKARWIIAAIVVVAPISISLVQYYTYNEAGKTLTSTIIQPNIEPYTEKFTLPQQEQTDILLSLSQQAPSDVDYIIMPETAIDDGIWEDELTHNGTVEQIRTLAKERYPDTQFVVGATTYRRYMPGDKVSRTARTNNLIDYWYDIYNTAFTVDTSALNQLHHKSVLVVGVEKLPYKWFTKYLEFLIVDLGGTTGQLGVDSKRAVFEHPNGTLASAAICYESVYGDYFSDFVRNGAQVMFVITNDGWWGDTPGYKQHFSYSRLRAIETRRSIVRSANTGISGFIDQRGDVIQKMGWDVRGTLTETIVTNDRITFYTTYGDYVARFSCYIFGLCLLYLIAYQLRRRSNLTK